MQTTFIYGLKDPLTDLIRYVGKSDNPKRRFKAHLEKRNLNDAKNSLHKKNWLKKLLKQNLKPILVIIEEVPYDIWEEKEIYYIEYYNLLGNNLTNGTKGGESGSGSNRKKIVALNLDGTLYKIYESITEATKELNIKDRHSIGRTLNEKRNKKCKNLLWLYYDKYIIMTKEEIDAFVTVKLTYNYVPHINPKTNSKEVHRYEKSGEYIDSFKSLREASNFLTPNKRNDPSISEVCKNKRKQSLGFRWSFIKNDNYFDIEKPSQ